MLRILFFILAACLTAAGQQVVNCPVKADTWLSMDALDTPDKKPEGSAENHGTDPRLSLSGHDSFAVLQFDVSGLKGRRIEKAVLRIHRADSDPVPLHTVGISTVSGTAAWAEGSREAGPAQPGESNFFFARSEQQPWSYPGSTIIDVIFGQGGSLYSYERVRHTDNGWDEVDVPAQIVAALASGDQFGIVLTDEKGQTHTLHKIDSRESQSPSVLVVTVSATAEGAPGKVRTRPMANTPDEAHKLGRSTFDPGSIILSFGGAGEGHAVTTHYDLRYSDKPIAAADFDQASSVPRWMLDPLAPKPSVTATSNSLQDWVVAVVDRLKPGAIYYFAARAVDAAGTVGPVSSLGPHRAYSRVFPALPAPAASVSMSETKPMPSAQPGDGIQVWAVPELLKIQPRTGELLEKEYSNHRVHNAIWDASTATVKLQGARNEFLGFQLAIESAHPFSGVEVNVSNPLFGLSKLPPVFEKSGAIQLSREWFVPGDKGEWYADALAPLKSLSIPSPDNAVPGQIVAPVFVDIYVPHDAAPGKHLGELLVHGEGIEKRLRIEVEVLPLTLPDKLGFLADLMGYDGVPLPDGMREGTPEYRALVQAYHRVAHLHRTNVDIVPYDQTGATQPDMAPSLQGEGAATRVASWENWDAYYAPLLNGSAFQDLPRAGVPVPAVYLPLFENWPGDMRKSYAFEQPEQVRTVQEYNELITRHALSAGPIGEMFSRDYQERFSAVASEFARHFRERGWLATQYLVYLNNKYYFKNPDFEDPGSIITAGRGTSFWLLDEPNHRDDFLALSFFLDLTRRGLAEYPDVPIRLKSDISRVDWIRDLLAGQIDVDNVSARFFDKNRYLTQDHNRFGRKFWTYASTNHPRTSNVAMRAWCWKAWINGADAVVPWSAVDGKGAWDHAKDVTVFYPGDKFGQLEPFPSLRLKAYRRGEQDIEYLILLAGKQGWDREAVVKAVQKQIDLGGGTTQSYDEDAGKLFFSHLQDDQMDELRIRVARALMVKQ